MTDIDDYIAIMHRIPGWLTPLDAHLFRDVCMFQSDSGHQVGDLVEIGAYEGKAAILLGYLVRQGERLLVCDTFEDSAATETLQYKGLSRRHFEANYLRFHPDLPDIFQCPSADLLPRVDGDTSARFLHIDGSHLYQDVRTDIRTAKKLIGPDGIMAFDDYRSGHTPGVAAAIWEEVATGGLVPLWITEMKLYATWEEGARNLTDHLTQSPSQKLELRYETHVVRGHELMRYWVPGPRWEALARKAYERLSHLARLARR